MKISAEIQNVARDNKISIEILSLDASQKVKADILRKYVFKKTSIFLWENFVDYSTVNDSNGWALIADFVKEKQCLMLFDDCEDKAVIRICGGGNLHKLLSETYGFEFYITNLSTDYIICFNHHDCLMGCGTAKKWISNLG